MEEWEGDCLFYVKTAIFGSFISDACSNFAGIGNESASVKTKILLAVISTVNIINVSLEVWKIKRM